MSKKPITYCPQLSPLGGVKGPMILRYDADTNTWEPVAYFRRPKHIPEDEFMEIVAAFIKLNAFASQFIDPVNGGLDKRKLRYFAEKEGVI